VSNVSHWQHGASSIIQSNGPTLEIDPEVFTSAAARRTAAWP
jgi:hypothetical protein